MLKCDGCHGNDAVLFSDGVDVVTRDHVTYLLFFFLRGRCVIVIIYFGINVVLSYSITMVASDGTVQPKCVKSIDEGHTVLTKGNVDFLKFYLFEPYFTWANYSLIFWQEKFSFISVLVNFLMHQKFLVS